PSLVRPRWSDGCSHSGPEGGQADHVRAAVSDGSERPGGPGREVYGVEGRPRGGVSAVFAGRVGDDVEAAQRTEVDAERADGGEDAVVRRVLQDQDVALLVDLEQLRVGGVGDVMGIRRGSDPRALAGARIAVLVAQRAIHRGCTES